MKDKNGVEIKIGDRIISKGKFEYEIRLVSDKEIIKSWGETSQFLIARGKNLHHTEMLSKLDLTQVAVCK